MIDFQQIPLAVLIDEEAAAYLRLDEGRDNGAAVKALNRLVDKGLLRPAIIGNHRRYSIAELNRFIADQTAAYGDLTG